MENSNVERKASNPPGREEGWPTERGDAVHHARREAKWMNGGSSPDRPGVGYSDGEDGAPIDALRGRCYTRPRCGKGKRKAAGHGAPPNRAFAHVTFRRNRSQEAMMSRKHG